MITDVTTATDSTATAAAMKKSLGLNKDDFLKLFMAQLQYQDPMKPQDATAMLESLSQLSLIEQSYNSGTAINNLLTAQTNSNAMTAVSFIGKDLQAFGHSTTFNGTDPSSLSFNYTVPTTDSTVTIRNAAGQVVRTVTTGALSAGDSTFTWDGRDNGGVLLPAGEYKFSVAGASASGPAITATTFTTGRITGVNLSGGTPVLTVGAASVKLTDVINVKGA